MVKPTQLRAVLYDLDGTLVDTIGDITYALNAALAVAGVPPITRATCKKYVGRGLKKALCNALSAADVTFDEILVETLLKVLLETYQQYPYQQAVVYPGMEALLHKSIAGGLQLGVLSNKDDDLVQVIVDELFPTIPFVLVQGASSAAPLKPDPTTARWFASKAECPLEQVLMVGDSEIDYYTAQAANMPVAVATWGFRSRFDLEAAGCKPLYDSVLQLETEVFSWL